MKVVVFPMHTTEKALSEGFRTRDWHLLREFALSDRVDQIDIIDRPSTAAEFVARRRAWQVGALESHLSRALGTAKVRIVPSRSRELLRPIRSRQAWWAEAYGGTVSGPTSRAARRRIEDADALLTFVPVSAEMWAGHPSAVVDLLDNWLIHPQLGGRAPSRFRRCYEETFSNANGVSANSEGTAALAAEFGVSPRLIPNGVEWDVFQARARAEAPQWRTSLRAFARPWIVYAGKLQQRLDRDLVARLAQVTSGTIFLAGPILDSRWVQPLRNAPRVAWLGDVSYDRLPGLIGQADVAIIPHRVGDGEVGGDPIKVYEYAAGGARIVSTPIIGFRRFGDLACITSANDFPDAVESLGVDDRSLDERLSTPAPAGVTWRERADSLLALLQKGAENVTQAA